MSKLDINKAKVSDVKDIHAILSHFANNKLLLARSLSDLYENIRDFFVIRNGKNELIGVCALHVVWEDLAEIRSLAVREEYQRQGFGSKLVQSALQEAKHLELKKVFTLTYKVDFFIKNGFKIIDKSLLPHKIWADCIKCPKFPNCDEIALIAEL